MTSILSDIAGFGRSSGFLDRAVTRERMPVLAASFDASAALSLGTSYLLSGGVGGSLGQALRSFSLTSQVGSLGARLGLGSFQTGSLSRGLWAAPMAMPMFPMFGGMWPGMMGAGGMFGAPAGSFAGGSSGDTTPRRLMAHDRHAPATAAAASDNAAKSGAKPGTAAKTAAAAGAGKPAKAGKAGKAAATPGEKVEQQWKKAAERLVRAVKKHKGLKDAIDMKLDVVGRKITITTKPGAKPSEKQLTAFVKAVTKLVNGKGPLGGSVLMVGGKKYDGKIAVADLVKTLMPVVAAAAGATPPAVAPAGLAPQFKRGTELKAFAALVANHAQWKHSLSIVVNTNDATITITRKSESPMSKADAQAFVTLLNRQSALRGVSVYIGALSVGTVLMSREDAADMVAQLSTAP